MKDLKKPKKGGMKKLANRLESLSNKKLDEETIDVLEKAKVIKKKNTQSKN